MGNEVWRGKQISRGDVTRNQENISSRGTKVGTVEERIRKGDKRRNKRGRGRVMMSYREDRGWKCGGAVAEGKLGKVDRKVWLV